MSIQAISDVLPILDSLGNKVTVKESQKSLQELLKTIPKAIDEIIIFQRKPEMKKFSHKMKLCSSQMAKVLPPLCRVISAGTDPALFKICNYLVAKLGWCLSEIVRILNGGGVEEDSEPSGLFVQSMDSFVAFLNDDSKEDSQDMNLFVDDLLMHALTIAKIAENEDYNEISAACRNVLSNFGGKTSMEEVENAPLKKDAMFCSLVNLERKVNIAVLRLFLFVMSKFIPPIKNVIKKCGVDQSETRQIGDIDQELHALDVYFERVQLIGNYAVASTECKKQKLKVQCSLASLEFLANYIIPATESFYMEDTNMVKRRFLQFLTDECIDELKTLTGLLDNIINTPAFFQVIQEDLAQSIPNLKTKFSKGVYDPQDSNEIIVKCFKLVSHLITTDDLMVKDNQRLIKKTKEFKIAVKAHARLTREIQPCNEKKFYSTLDRIIQKLEELDEHLTCTFMSRSQKINLSQPVSSTFEAVTSTPFAPTGKENGTANIFPATPSTPERNHSLDPYLDQIFETPILRSTLYSRVPYKSKMSPRNPSPDFIEVLETLDINYTTDEEGSSNSFTDDQIDDESLMYDSDISKNISIESPSEFNSVNTLARDKDIEFLENKIKHLTSTEQ